MLSSNEIINAIIALANRVYQSKMYRSLTIFKKLLLVVSKHISLIKNKSFIMTKYSEINLKQFMFL